MLLTQELVSRLWADMAAKDGFRVRRKRKSALMHIYAAGLSTIGVCSGKTFWKHMVTTTARTIYVPFTPGSMKSEFSLLEQVVVLAHEMQHMDQRRSMGVFWFGTGYALSQKIRCRLEVDAYRAGQTLYARLTHDRIAPVRLADKLKHYGIEDDLINGYALKRFRATNRKIDKGYLHGAAEDVWEALVG